MDKKLQGNGSFFCEIDFTKKKIHGVNKKQEIILDDDIVSSHFDKIVL